MKILHLVPSYFPAVRYGGPIYSVHALCKSLVEAGHEVYVFTTNVDGGQDSDVPLGVPVEMDGVLVFYFESRFLRRLYYAPGLAVEIKARIRHFDIVHLHSVFLWPTWVAARVARKMQVPYMISPRGMLVKDMVRRKARWVKTAWIKLVEKKNIECASALHVTSELEAKALEDFNFKLPAVFNISNGVDCPCERKHDDLSDDVKKILQQDRYVLYFGRINWKKGLDRLIQSWSNICDSQLVIAGNDEEDFARQLQGLAESEGVRQRVSFLPRSISGADKEALFEGAHLFVLPSYSENFGNTVLEAMIHGVPVVVTPEVGAAEVVRNSNAGIVVDGEPGVMAPAIQELLNDEQRMDKMGKAGKLVAALDFSWPKIAESMQDAYQLIIDKTAKADVK